MDDEMKKLLRALSDAVNESLINSNGFVDAVAAVWRARRDESPSVDAPMADADESAEVSADTTDPPAMLTLTADDEYPSLSRLQFLSSRLLKRAEQRFL